MLNLNMRLDGGTGAALGIFLAETATRILIEMATFAEAGVSEGDKGTIEQVFSCSAIFDHYTNPLAA